MKALFAALLGGILIILLSQAGLFNAAEVRSADVLQGGLQPLPDVRIVAIDEQSLAQLGQYPWSRTTHAELVSSLTEAGVRAIAIDIGFFDEIEGSEDLSQAISDAQAAGIPVIVTEEIMYDQGEEVTLTSRLGAATGYSNLFLDSDGIIRRVPLISDREPFALAVARQISTPAIPSQDQAIIRYFTPPGGIPRIAYVDALSDANMLKDKVVFVGVTAADLHDDYLTPVSHGKTMPGVEIHANIYMMIASQRYVQPVHWPHVFTILLALLGGLVIVFTFFLIHRPWLAFIGLALIPLYLLIVVLFFDQGILLPIATPIIGLFAGVGATIAWWMYSEQSEKRYMRKAFEKYVSPEVIKDMLKDPAKLGLGGQRKELTILFSDIRGFTSFSEKMDAEELVTFLNEYLTEMTGIVLKHEGLVDKYIGDAIMALWNAPLDQEKHACLAADAALKQIACLKQMQKETKFQALRIGIGIHTGEAVVGNMGSEDRFDYTAIGDNVNLASRLEGLTKMYGVDIIVSEETQKQLDENFAARKLDMVRVKGKKKPVVIYELVPERTHHHDDFEEALDLYFKGEWKKARKLFKLVNDKPSKVFLDRIALLTKRKKKDFGEWNGVWTHESK